MAPQEHSQSLPVTRLGGSNQERLADRMVRHGPIYSGS
jgi:hypothetical protein